MKVFKMTGWVLGILAGLLLLAGLLPVFADEMPDRSAYIGVVEKEEEPVIPFVKHDGRYYSGGFSYFHVAGSALRPRDSAVEWDTGGSGGCVFTTSGSSSISYNIHMDLPHGSLIEYLRIYYYDTSANDSTAWITTYDDAGGLSDLTSVDSTGTAGYGTQLSGYVGVVPNYGADSYVLNWRPRTADNTSQLCGLRVAYRLPVTNQIFLPMVLND